MTIPIAIFPQLGKSSIMTGALFSTKAILQIISSPFVARYIDNYNLEPMILGLMIESISTIIFSLTSNYYFWCIARAISGIASSLIISSGFLHIQRVYTTPTEMGHAMSTVATGIILGVTAGPPLGGVMYGSWEPLPFVFMVGLLAIATGAAHRLQNRKYGKGWGQGVEGGGGGNNDKEEFREKVKWECEGGGGGGVGVGGGGRRGNDNIMPPHTHTYTHTHIFAPLTPPPPRPLPCCQMRT
jgi:hypothetical protein